MRTVNFDKNYIENLSVYNQLNAWSFILGFNAKLNDKIKSPFRIDNTPLSCWLEVHNGKVILTDYACAEFHNVGLYKAFKLLNPTYTPQQIFNVIGSLTIGNFSIGTTIVSNKIKKEMSYEIRTHNGKFSFTENEKNYWESYGISLKQLINDKVFSCKSFSINDFKTINVEMSFVMLLQNNFKIYNPLNVKGKWFSNTNNDNYWYIKNNSDTIVITTSYKDCRVIANMTGYSSFAPVSEIAKLTYEQKTLIESYKNIIVIGDGDTTGDNFAISYNNLYGYDYIIFPQTYRQKTNKYNKKIKDLAELYRYDNSIKLI